MSNSSIEHGSPSTRRRPWRLPVGAAVALALGLTACGSSSKSAADTPSSAPAASAGPIAVKNCDATVKLDKPATRAVAISQPAIELLLTLGQAEHMVGAAGWNAPVPAELASENAKVPQWGQDFPSLEKVLQADPDFVYTTFAYGFTSEGTGPRAKFADLGVATYLSPSECTGQEATQTKAYAFEDLYSEIRDVSQVFGVSDRGDQLVTQLKGRLSTATGGLDAKGVTLAWWYASTKTPYIAGCCGAPGMITKELGATNAFESNKQLWPETSWEAIVDRNPDVLVLADLTRGDDGDSAEAKIKFLESNPATRTMSAVQNKRYIIVDASNMDPSIENVRAVETIANGLRKLGVTGS